MSTPRHRTVPGSSYFVTIKCWEGRTAFQVAEIAEIMSNILFEYRDRGAYLLHEFVIMPDHIHVLLTPSSSTSLEKAIQFIKGGSSHRIHKERNQKMEIWQMGFYDWTIRNYNDWQTKVEYIHMNPVKARLVQKPGDWAYSSASGKFALDPVPPKYLKVSSGAKAPVGAATMQGLKPLPPKEKSLAGSSTRQAKSSTGQAKSPTAQAEVPGAGHVGAKAPTPGAAPRVSVPSGAKAPIGAATMQGLKPLPPKENGSDPNILSKAAAQ